MCVVKLSNIILLLVQFISSPNYTDNNQSTNEDLKLVWN